MPCRKKLRALGTTTELTGVSDRAGAKLKKLRAKKKKQLKSKKGDDEDLEDGALRCCCCCH